jgi:hypothetical protein
MSRPLKGEVPTIDLVMGYSNLNPSPILKLFLSRADDLIARVSQKGPLMRNRYGVPELDVIFVRGTW